MNLGTGIDEIIADFEERILTIRLNRPGKKNALFAEMYTRMAELVKEAGQSDAVRALYITGTRDCFSSGNDVSTFTGMEPDENGDTPPINFLKALARCELPVVAAVNGPAIGVGTTMLLLCDFIVAGADAMFQAPFVNLGVCPEAASSYTLPQRMGYSRAAEMLMLCETFSATQALDAGLVHSVHPREEYQDAAMAIARRLALQPPKSIRATKKLMRAPLHAVLDQVMEEENVLFQACMGSPEFTEAIAAFMEKRAPDFSDC